MMLEHQFIATCRPLLSFGERPCRGWVFLIFQGIIRNNRDGQSATGVGGQLCFVVGRGEVEADGGGLNVQE